jgi:hypothetical protein
VRVPPVVATERESVRLVRLKALEIGVRGARGMADRWWRGVRRDSSMGLIGGTVERGGFGAVEEGEVSAIVEPKL